MIWRKPEVELEVYVDRILVRDRESLATVDLRAEYRFSYGGTLIGDLGTFEYAVHAALGKLYPTRHLLTYPVVHVTRVESAIAPIERYALERSVLAAGASKVLIPETEYFGRFNLQSMTSSEA